MPIKQAEIEAEKQDITSTVTHTDVVTHDSDAINYHSMQTVLGKNGSGGNLWHMSAKGKAAVSSGVLMGVMGMATNSNGLFDG